MTSATIICNAAIGKIAFDQHDTEAYGFTTEQWIGRACGLYVADARTENTSWHVYTSEIWVDDIDEPVAGLDFCEIAQECMSEAFEALSDEGEARSTDAAKA